jgi:hypothetical protein
MVVSCGVRKLTVAVVLRPTTKVPEGVLPLCVSKLVLLLGVIV